MTIEDYIESMVAEHHECRWIDSSELEELLRKVALEEKKIVIDNACEWIGNYLIEIGYPDDWMRDSTVMVSGKQRFLEAME